jgi:hypothetical protein
LIAVNVHIFLASVRARLDSVARAKEAYQRTLSPDFNPLLIIGLGENKMSSILAFLLDPKQTHGQGSAFLRAFLHHLDLGGWEIGSGAVRVTAEARTDRIEATNRRIDLLLEGDNFVIAIENKFFAVDQDKQLSDYRDQISALASSKRKKYCLIYLTPEGEPPDQGSIAREQLLKDINSGHLKLLSYKDGISAWLADCQRVAASPAVWTFLSNLMSYIENAFWRAPHVNSVEIVRAATETPEAVSAALQVASAADDIKLTLARRLQEQLEEACVAQGWQVTGPFNGKRETGLTIDFGHPRGVFRLQSQAVNFGWVVFGIRKRNPEDENDASIRSRLEAVADFKGGMPNDSWYWHKPVGPKDVILPVEVSWNASPDPWVAIANGALAKTIMSAAKRFKNELETASPSGPV